MTSEGRMQIRKEQGRPWPWDWLAFDSQGILVRFCKQDICMRERLRGESWREIKPQHGVISTLHWWLAIGGGEAAGRNPNIER